MRFKYFDITLRDATALGGSFFFMFLVLAVLVTGGFMLSLRLLFGFFFSLLIVVLIRTFYYRDRPKKQHFRNYLQKIDASSFPSWHAARVIFLSLTFGNLLQNTYFALFLIVVALLVTYSRIFLEKHDKWDVAGGIVLGVVTWWVSLFI